MTDRDDALDQVAAFALGILPPDEARRVSEQIAADEELNEEFRSYRGVADLIGFAAEAEPTAIDELQRARMKSRLLKAIRMEGARQPGRTARAAWPAYAIAAAALVAALLASIEGTMLRGQLAAEHEQNVALQRQVAAQARDAASERAQLADLFSPDGKHYAVRGGEVIARNGRVYIVMRSLPKLPPGKVFQAWTLARGAKTVAPSVTFTPNSAGSAIVKLPPQKAPLAAVAVSVEPLGGSKAPTSTPTFIRPLS